MGGWCGKFSNYMGGWCGKFSNYKTFCGFPWVETSTAGRVYDLCVLLHDGSTRRLTESGFMWFYGFMEKPGIEPATPGLQGIALIHYTTGASLKKKKKKKNCGFSMGRNQYWAREGL